TFWPAINKVHVRIIGEDINTETLKDTVADVAMLIGGSQVLAQPAVPIIAATRFTKEFWIGGAPEPKVNVDHNLAYLAKTKFLPNFDASLIVPEASIAGPYAKWQKAPKRLYDAGFWAQHMGNPGARDEIGPLTGNEVLWLYTGDWRMLEMVRGLADLAGAWPL